MAHEFSTSYVRDAEKTFHYYKHLAERAIAQVPDEALTQCLDAESNSIALDRETHGRKYAFALD